MKDYTYGDWVSIFLKVIPAFVMAQLFWACVFALLIMTPLVMLGFIGLFAR